MNRLQAATLLGVDSNASSAEAKKAYTTRARLLHPDRFSGGSEADIAAANAAMAQLNEAYEVFTSGGRSSEESPSATGESVVVECQQCGKRNRVPESARAAMCANCKSMLLLPWVDEETAFRGGVSSWPDPATACDLCGWGPAQRFTYRSVTGIIIWWQWSKFEAVMCSECNRTMYNESQARTLTTGWWGIIAPLAAILAFVLNWSAFRGSKDLPEPQARNLDKVTLSPIPLVGAKPYWKRPLPLIGTGVALAITVFLLALFWNSQPPSRTDSGSVVDAGTESAFDLQVGDCINDTIGERVTSIEVVPCSSPHVYEVYANRTISLTQYSRDEVEKIADRQCLQEFEGYVGTPYVYTGYYYTYIFPTPESWATGDRGVTCLLFLPDEVTTTGSARD